jgi:hypothetical protein
MNEDEILRALRAELNVAHFSEFIQELSDIYETTEHELASGWRSRIHKPEPSMSASRSRSKLGLPWLMR